MILSAALLLAAPGAAVTNASATVTDLGPVTVVARPITQEESLTDDGAELTLLSRDQLSALNAQDLQTALRQVPGVTLSRYAPIGSYGGAQGGSLYLRGAGTARPGGEVRFYTDGIPRESGVWGHPLMDAVPVDFASSVAVLKSPHPGYAADAFGTVDIETRRRREEGFEAEAEAAYGRHDTFLSRFSAGAKEGLADAYGGISHKESHGLRAHNDARLEGAFARAGAELSATERLDFTYQRTESRVEDPGEKGSPTPLRDAFGLATDAYALRFSTERDRVKGFSLVYFEHGDIAWHKDHLSDGVATSPAGYADTTWLNWGTRHRYDLNAWKDLFLTLALDVTDEGGHTKNTRESDGKDVFGFKGRTLTVAPYAALRYAFAFGDDWKFTPSAGVRAYYHAYYPNKTAPVAALRLDWRDTLEFGATASRGVHYPGLYTRAVASDFARHTLAAETMDYVGGSVKAKAGDSADLTLALFHTEVHNRIDKTATGYINAGEQRASGAELSAHWNPRDDLSLFGGVAFTAPETPHPSRLPRWTCSLGATWKVCAYLKLSLDAQYIGSMRAYSVRTTPSAAELRKLDDAFLCNARLALPLESVSPLTGEIYLSLENLFDTNYAYYPGYPMGGTMAYIGCRITF